MKTVETPRKPMSRREFLALASIVIPTTVVLATPAVRRVVADGEHTVHLPLVQGGVGDPGVGVTPAGTIPSDNTAAATNVVVTEQVTGAPSAQPNEPGATVPPGNGGAATAETTVVNSGTAVVGTIEPPEVPTNADGTSIPPGDASASPDVPTVVNSNTQIVITVFP